MKSEDAKLINQYLLGELPDQERARFEERLFADDLFFQEIEAARDQLGQDYLRGVLTRHERERFESYFLASPRRRKGVETTRALIGVADRPAVAEALRTRQSVLPLRRSRWNLWLAAAAVVVLAVGIVLVIQTVKLRSRLRLLEDERATLENEERALRQQLSEKATTEQQIAKQLSDIQGERAKLEEELEASRKGGRIGSVESSIASLTLSPVLVRDESKIPLLKITPNIRRLRLSVSFDAPRYNAYEATLETVEGRRVWHGARLKASGRAVTLSIGANQLGSADYLLTLSGVSGRRTAEEVGKYYFRVVNQ